MMRTPGGRVSPRARRVRFKRVRFCFRISSTTAWPRPGLLRASFALASPRRRRRHGSRSQQPQQQPLPSALSRVNERPRALASVQGGDGVISVTANVAPAAVSRVMAAAAARDAVAAEAADSPLAALHRDLFCEANPIPVKWALAKMGRAPAGIRSPLSPLGADFHGRVEAALQQANCIEREATAVGGSFGWPSRDLLLQGHLFDQNLINQALELIEKRGGDFEITAFSVQPNDQNSEFNFRRTSSASIRMYAVDTHALDDITTRLRTLVEVMESAEGSLTEIPAAA